MDNIDLTKLMDIALIERLYQQQIQWFAQYDINFNQIYIFPTIIMLFTGGMIFTAFGFLKQNTWGWQLWSIFSRVLVTVLAALCVMPTMNHIGKSNYENYLKNVKIELVKYSNQLTASERKVISACLNSSLSENYDFVYHNYSNSGERFDTCILRFVNISLNKSMKREYNLELKSNDNIKKLAEEIKNSVENPEPTLKDVAENTEK